MKPASKFERFVSRILWPPCCMFVGAGISRLIYGMHPDVEFDAMVPLAVDIFFSGMLVPFWVSVIMAFLTWVSGRSLVGWRLLLISTVVIGLLSAPWA